MPRRVVYEHLGWRKIGERWAYLHAGGAIGAEGMDGCVEVVPPTALALFSLPEPPKLVSEEEAVALGRLAKAARQDSVKLVEAVRASLGFLDLGPARLVFPLLAAVYRAVLAPCDFSLHLAGPTGSFKSEVAAICQQHFGAGMDSRHLPGSWSSTGNSLEALAFAAANVLLVVDDFAPNGSTADVQRYHREADRIFRAQGNNAGRARCRENGSVRSAKPPRGLILSTGEDIPRGQSVRARLLILEVSLGHFGPQPPRPNQVLTACQTDARGGKYALALAGFVRWPAPRYEEIRSGLLSEAAELRGHAASNGEHARTRASWRSWPWVCPICWSLPAKRESSTPASKRRSGNTDGARWAKPRLSRGSIFEEPSRLGSFCVCWRRRWPRDGLTSRTPEERRPERP